MGWYAIHICVDIPYPSMRGLRGPSVPSASIPTSLPLPLTQSLWHLEAFRGPMLSTSFSALEAKGSSPADKRVMTAVWRIFRAMAAVAAETSNGGNAAAESSGSSVAEEAGADGAPPTASAAGVSPRELRAALCGQSAIHVDPSDMHDAGEVFAEILGILHRAELGVAGGGVAGSVAAGGRSAAAAAAAPLHDLQLPRRVKIAAPLLDVSPRCSPAPASAVAAAAGAVSSPYAAALMAGAAAAASAAANQSTQQQQGPSTLVHTIFGLDVQMPCPATTTSEDGRGGGGGGEGGADDVRSGKGGRRSPPPPLALGAPPAPARSLKDSGFVEVQQFTKVRI